MLKQPERGANRRFQQDHEVKPAKARCLLPLTSGYFSSAHLKLSRWYDKMDDGLALDSGEC
jgi:hypothetical protein